MKRSLQLIIVSLLLCSCAGGMQNPSAGRPEILIKTTDKAAVKERIVNDMLNRGYVVAKSDDLSVTMEKPITGMASVLYGSRFNSTPNARIIFSIVRADKATRVVADMQIVTNPGSGAEHTTSANGGPDAEKIQAYLNSLSGFAVSKKTKP